MAKREFPEGLTEDELKALTEADADDTATADADVHPAVLDFNKAKEAVAGIGAEKGGDKPAGDAATDKAATEKAAADKAAADKAAADKAAAEKIAADKIAADEAAKAKAAAETGDKAKPDAAATAEAAKAEAQPEPRAQRTVMPDWQAPENAEAKLKEIATKRDELGDKFDNGELTGKELLAEQNKLNKEERDIERAMDRAEMATEMTTAVWSKNTVPAFLDANAHYRDNPTLLGMLDTEVRRQQVAAGEAGKDPLDPAILGKADEAIKLALGKMGMAPAANADPAKPGKTALAAKPVIPPTLGNVPAAEISGTDSAFASLDRLADANAAAFEDAFAKLPEAQRDAYLARQ